MSLTTEIQWCDTTVNPVMGCDGCELRNRDEGVRRCYAGTLHDLRKGNRGYAPTFEQVTLFPGRTAEAARTSDLAGTVRLLKPWLDGLPRLIFVSDMGDALSKSVPVPYLEAEVIVPAASAAGLRHRWLWLTKRPPRMARFSEWLRERGITWPSNIWAGTSITTNSTERIGHLLKVGDENTTRFLSVEPQSEWCDLSSWLPRLDWVIQGGESGRQPLAFDLAWARRLRDECEAATVPYFLKQLGRRPLEDGGEFRLHDAHGGDWVEWPVDLRVRQMPEPREEQTISP